MLVGKADDVDAVYDRPAPRPSCEDDRVGPEVGATAVGVHVVVAGDEHDRPRCHRLDALADEGPLADRVARAVEEIARDRDRVDAVLLRGGEHRLERVAALGAIRAQVDVGGLQPADARHRASTYHRHQRSAIRSGSASPHTVGLKSTSRRL